MNQNPLYQETLKSGDIKCTVRRSTKACNKMSLQGVSKFVVDEITYR